MELQKYLDSSFIRQRQRQDRFFLLTTAPQMRVPQISIM
jgi:hypothetical protein